MVNQEDQSKAIGPNPEKRTDPNMIISRNVLWMDKIRTHHFETMKP